MDIDMDKFYPPTIGWQDGWYEKDRCRCQKVEKSFCLPGLTCVQNIGVSFTSVRHCPNSDAIVVSYAVTIWFESCCNDCGRHGCDCKRKCCTAVEHGSVIFRDLPFDTDDCCDFVVPLPHKLCRKERCGEVTVCFTVKICEKDD